MRNKLGVYILLIFLSVCTSCTKPSSKFINGNFAGRSIVYNGYIGTIGESADEIHMEISCDKQLQIRGHYTIKNGKRQGLVGSITKENRRYILRLNEVNSSFELTGGGFVISDFRYGEVSGRYWGPMLKVPHEHAWEVTYWDADGNKQKSYQQVRDIYLKEPPIRL